MSWVVPDNVAGREAFKMEHVGDYRKVDTDPKNADEVDGAEPNAPASEWVRGGATLDERYGDRAPAESPDGKY